MKKFIPTIITVLVVAAGIICGLIFSPGVNELQIETLKVVGIMCAVSALYVFVVGEISRNNSQMDKIWSIIPIAYTWVISGMSGFNFRTVIIAIIVTLWGVRLTINFARKGAYSIKFWEGEEDYRWVVLREKKFLSNKFVWALFDLFFISIYQNAIVLLMCLPAVAVMCSNEPFGVMDVVATTLALGFLTLETIADEQQWKFHSKKKELLKDGAKLEDIEKPYNKGFNTTGLWKYARHPNYFGEQAIWVSIYLFVIAAKVGTYIFFNWSIIGCLLIVLLFLGSSMFGEGVSSSKYPEYELYQKEVSKYVPNPFKGYRH